MSDLSRPLVDAAAEADWQAHNAAVLKVIGKRGTYDEKRRAVSQARSRAAVAAVLETLKAWVDDGHTIVPLTFTCLLDDLAKEDTA